MKTKIGNATIHLCDCMDGFQTLEDQSIDFVVTDPPYECSTSRITRNNQSDLNSDFGEWDRFFTDWVVQAFRVLKPDSGMIVFVPATRFETLMFHCEEAGFTYVQPWFWHKTNPAVVMRAGLQWAVEHMIYVRKGKSNLNISNKGRCHNIFRYPIPHPRIHDTQKPVDLMVKIVEYVSNKGDTILDPFFGSGSTGIAAVNRGRKFVGFEKHEPHFKDALKRFRSDRDLF